MKEEEKTRYEIKRLNLIIEVFYSGKNDNFYL